MKRWLASFVSEQQRLRLSELKDKKSIKNVPFKFGIFSAIFLKKSIRYLVSFSNTYFVTFI
jgi:hypothetical protein